MYLYKKGGFGDVTWVQHLSSLETRSIMEHVRVACGVTVYFQRPFDNTVKHFSLFYLQVALTSCINVSQSGIFCCCCFCELSVS